MSRRSKVSQDDLPLLASLQVSLHPQASLEHSLNRAYLQFISYGLQCSTFSVLPPAICFLQQQPTQQHLCYLQDMQLQAGVDGDVAPGPNILSDVLRVIQYLPQALMYVTHNCTHLKELSLTLLSPAAVNSSRGGNTWDHPSLLKRSHFRLGQMWSRCTNLHSLTLVNVPSR